MKTLIIDEKGVMYLANTKDFYDLKLSRRRKSSILPTLEQADKEDVPIETWTSREYVDFICNVEANSRKYTKAKMKRGGRTVNAYGYLQELRKNQWNVAAQIEGHIYIIPIEDAIEFTLGLVEGYELDIRFASRARIADHYGVTNYLIVE